MQKSWLHRCPALVTERKVRRVSSGRRKAIVECSPTRWLKRAVETGTGKPLPALKPLQTPLIPSRASNCVCNSRSQLPRNSTGLNEGASSGGRGADAGPGVPCMLKAAKLHRCTRRNKCAFWVPLYVCLPVCRGWCSRLKAFLSTLLLCLCGGRHFLRLYHPFERRAGVLRPSASDLASDRHEPSRRHLFQP